jgi:hypothetical protein
MTWPETFSFPKKKNQKGSGMFSAALQILTVSRKYASLDQSKIK